MKNNQSTTAKKTANVSSGYLIRLPTPKTRSHKNKTDRQVKLTAKSATSKVIKKPVARP